MFPKRFVVVFGALIIGCGMLVGNAQAQEPGWTTGVVKRGIDRIISNETDILDRPYRPLHFYGNTQRRRHYQGRALPSRHDLRMTAAMLRQSGCRGGSPGFTQNHSTSAYVDNQVAPHPVNVADTSPAYDDPSQISQQRPPLRSRRQMRRSTGQLRRR